MIIFKTNEGSIRVAYLYDKLTFLIDIPGLPYYLRIVSYTTQYDNTINFPVRMAYKELYDYDMVVSGGKFILNRAKTYIKSLSLIPIHFADDSDYKQLLKYLESIGVK